mmetsp:Transcript_13035/g.35083  ORF Transcript_13035/g.35083 Transcript_13035/m.35083 type:complete len:95 (+) Transcript_13035:70-354(+)
MTSREIQTRFLKRKRTQCAESEECARLRNEFLEACILDCISHECYEQVYASEPVSLSRIALPRFQAAQTEGYNTFRVVCRAAFLTVFRDTLSNS